MNKAADAVDLVFDVDEQTTLVIALCYRLVEMDKAWLRSDGREMTEPLKEARTHTLMGLATRAALLMDALQAMGGDE